MAAQYAAWIPFDRVILSTAKPHKNAEGVLDTRHRVAMVELAIADNPAFEMSTLEVERSGRYLYHGPSRFCSRLIGAEIYFIMGGFHLHSGHLKDNRAAGFNVPFYCGDPSGYELKRSDPTFKQCLLNFGEGLVFRNSGYGHFLH